MSGRFCPSCGAQVPPDAHFCVACGAALDAPGAPPPFVPSGTPPSQPPASKGSSTAGWVVAGVLGALVLLLVGIGVVVLVGRGGDSGDARAIPTTVGEDEVVLEPVGIEIPDPFTADVAVAEAALVSQTDDDPLARAGAAGGAVTGSTPGLYGGTLDESSCDRTQLVAFLESEPSKARAWAGVVGIEPDDIADYVAGLTPVVLRWDTRVMNHGYDNGRATPRPAVLQAGTAVLVDDFGTPRVKCSCGNPLGDAPPVTSRTRYVGPRWAAFQPERIVTVRIDVRIDIFVLIEVRTGEPFGRPTGTAGHTDGPAPGGPATTETPTTTAPTPTTAPTTAPPATPAPTPPRGPDRAEEAITWVQGAACDLLYVVGWRSFELEPDLYQVEMHVQIEPGMEWWALYTVDFATQDFPTITPLNSESAAMLCS
ncbi:MAG: zinc ribbon domain-containing protein [Acidimicrobiia bacterium]|nr:zinc ribbon domain-containing protein [Acidimicrobiia bacterium]